MGRRELLLNTKEVAAAKKAFISASKTIQKQVRLYDIYAYPDLTEGKMGPRLAGIVALRIDEDSSLVEPEHYIEDYLYAQFGPKVQHVQSVAPIPGWRYEKVKNTKDAFEMVAPRRQSALWEISSFRNLLMVIEGIRVPEPIWSKYDFYKKIGMRRW